MANQTYKFVFTARVIFMVDGKMLFLKKRKKLGGGHSMVGGTVERNESIIQAAIRETKEEVGVNLKKSDLEIVHVQRRHKESEENIIYFLQAHNWTGEPYAKEPQKFKKVKWKSIMNLSDKLAPHLRHGVSQFIGGKGFSQYLEEGITFKEMIPGGADIEDMVNG